MKKNKSSNHNPSIWNLSFVNNLSDDTRVASLIIKHVIPLLVTLIVGFILTNTLTNSNNLTPTVEMYDAITIMMGCLVVMALCVFIAVLRLIAVEEQRNMFRITFSKDHPELLFGRSTAFDFCSAIAKQAKHSIFVVGPHFTNLLDNPGTKNHSTYLTEDMSAAITKHADNGEFEKDVFEYVRVIQLDATLARNSLVEDDHMSWNAIGNEALAKHVDAMLTINKASEFVNINIYARDFVPSLPSILVIDEQYVFFSLPTYLTRYEMDSNNGEISKVKTHRPGLNYDFVLEIEDKSGVIPLQFKRLIRQLTVDAVRIQGILPKEDDISKE